MAKRISIINFKGGVGKTTLAFNLAAGLARYHEKKVLLIDMDHQSSLSIVCMGGGAWTKAARKNTTVNSIFRHFVSADNPFPGSEIIVKSPIRGWRYANVDLVPANLSLDDTEIALTATHHGNAIESEWDKRTLLCRWIEETQANNNYDYIIFDCPPATKIVSQNAIAASHGYILPVVPEAVMERGAPHLYEMVRTGIDERLIALAKMGQARPIHVPDTKLVGVVITRITVSGPAVSGYTDDHTIHLESLKRRWKARLVEPYIVDGTGVSQALADGVPVYDRANTQNIGKRKIHTMYKNVVDQLVGKMKKLDDQK